MEKENRSLHSENQKFRLKNVSSKISTAVPGRDFFLNSKLFVMLELIVGQQVLF